MCYARNVGTCDTCGTRGTRGEENFPSYCNYNLFIVFTYAADPDFLRDGALGSPRSTFVPSAGNRANLSSRTSTIHRIQYMKTSTAMWALAAIVAMGLGTGCSDNTLAPTNPTSDPMMRGRATTAQSAMIQLSGGGTFASEGTQVWKFDKTAGAEYFDGGTQSDREWAADQQRCTFFDGGTLESKTRGSGPHASVMTPKSGLDVVSARTAWDLTQESTSSSTVDVNLSGLIVGESWMSNRTFPMGSGGTGTGGKYSFTLRNSDGTSRVENLAYQLVDGAGNVVSSGAIVSTQGHEDNLLYTKNAGNLDLYDGWVATILGGDTSNGNNADGADTETFSLPFTLGSGDYAFTVTGTIKGVSGAADLSLNVSSVLHISAQGCQ